MVARIFAIAIALLWCVGSALAETPFQRAQKNYETLTGDEYASQFPVSWRKAGAKFADAAQGADAAEALFLAGLCSERAFRLSNDEADVDAALASYRRVYDSLAASPFADDSLFRAARLKENREDADGAEGLYRHIIVKYPDGDMVELARRRLPELRKTVTVQALRHRSAPAYTRVVLDLTGTPSFSSGFLPEKRPEGLPPRIFVDVRRSAMGKGCDVRRSVLDGLVSQVRVAPHGKGVTRVVLDLKSSSTFRVFPLLGPDRLVIDVYRTQPETDLVADLIRGGKPDAAKPASARSFLVVLDPGHGGKDSGAVGPGGTQEKDIVLAMAKKLKPLLEERLGCRVLLTRDTDVFIPLPDRTSLANARGADLFLSIHANASPNAQSRGIETYYLDRASDRAAVRLAALENRTSETNVRETEQLLADILLNLKLPESQRLARTVQQALLSRVAQRHGAVRDLGVKRAPFYVLTGAIMPAVLLETAFVSNPEEEKWLCSDAYQETVADAVSAAVMEYVNENKKL